MVAITIQGIENISVIPIELITDIFRIFIAIANNNIIGHEYKAFITK